MLNFNQINSWLFDAGRQLLDCTHLSKKYLALLIFSIITFRGVTHAQFSCPDPARCVSKDLQVVDAFIEGVDNCFSCTTGETVTKKLFVAIANKTGSERTSFAVFANLVGGTFTSASAGGASGTSISFCAGPIPPNTTITTLAGTITFKCGDELKLTNVFEAWTSAAETHNSCAEILADKCASIAPKCGTLTELVIRTPLSVAYKSSVQPCEGTSTGSITFAATGGTAPYSYTLSGGALTTSVTNSTGTFTGLAASTTAYTVTVTDAKGCKSTATFTLTAKANPVVKVDNKTVCVGNTVTLTATPSGGTFSGAHVSGTTFSAVGVAPGDYTVTYTVTQNGCTGTGTGKVTVVAKPVCDIKVPTTLPNCGSTGNKLSVTATAGATYKWTVTGTGWAITAGQGTPTITYTAGSGGTSGVFTLEVTANSCTSTCSVTFTCKQVVFNGCTPGFWKNTRTRWDQTTDAVSACVAAAITAKGAPYNGTAITTSLFRNVFGLTSQQMINAGLDPNLTLLGALNTGGGGCFALVRHAVAALLSSCGFNTYTYTTNQVLTMTHDAIINGTCGTTASKLAAANEAGTCPLSSDGNNDQITSNQLAKPGVTTEDVTKLTVEATPNPFYTRIRFEIHSPVSGQGTLDLYNVLGQKMQSVYQGHIEAGKTKTVEYSVPSALRTDLIYRMSVGTQSTTGKLIQAPR